MIQDPCTAAMTATGMHGAGQALQGDWAKIRPPQKEKKNGRPQNEITYQKFKKLAAISKSSSALLIPRECDRVEE
jgi:hypothetical protein